MLKLTASFIFSNIVCNIALLCSAEAGISYRSSVGEFVVINGPTTCDIEHYFNGEAKPSMTDLDVGNRKDATAQMCAQGEGFTLSAGEGFRNKSIVRNVRAGAAKIDKVHVEHPGVKAKACATLQTDAIRQALEGEGAPTIELLKLKTIDVRITDNSKAAAVKDSSLSPRSFFSAHGRYLVRAVLTSKGECQLLSKDEVLSKLINQVGLTQPEVANELLTKLNPGPAEEEVTEAPAVTEVAEAKVVPAAPVDPAPDAAPAAATGGARSLADAPAEETAAPVQQMEDNENPFKILERHRAEEAAGK